jgi:hypothetical protein
MNKWIIYEQEKAKLQAQDLTPAEYDLEIARICSRLKI